MQQIIGHVLKQIVPDYIGFSYDDEEYIMTKDYNILFESNQPIIGYAFYMDRNKVKMFHFEVYKNGRVFAMLENQYLLEGRWR